MITNKYSVCRLPAPCMLLCLLAACQMLFYTTPANALHLQDERMLLVNRDLVEPILVVDDKTEEPILLAETVTVKVKTTTSATDKTKTPKTTTLKAKSTTVTTTPKTTTAKRSTTTSTTTTTTETPITTCDPKIRAAVEKYLSEKIKEESPATAMWIMLGGLAIAVLGFMIPALVYLMVRKTPGTNHVTYYASVGDLEKSISTVPKSGYVSAPFAPTSSSTASRKK